MSKKPKFTNEGGCSDHPHYHGIRAPRWGSSTETCKKCVRLYNSKYDKETRKNRAIHADKVAEWRRNW